MVQFPSEKSLSFMYQRVIATPWGKLFVKDNECNDMRLMKVLSDKVVLDVIEVLL